ncbi:Telomerase protein component 1 [Holothuria leucospilota]|uniref:Telomerase protein component 1 n=1 Tax=Holothuria leucospilota TaxID=206669 RepID=A0A9Q1BG74_HOLLE|nr:Telomerase protein component 1 [Holothuria leucospilota]
MLRKLHLIECDLRWGIPKDSTTAAVLCTCMDEIERCHGETDGQGMFLNMLGERYGWVPGVTDVPSHLVEQFQWVHNLSVTHMEILHGTLYRGINHNAAFFIRDPTIWLDKLPEDVQTGFIEQSELGQAQLKVLKSKLKEKYPKQYFEYSCHIEEPVKITETPSIKGLDDFGNNVLSFFKEAIAREYPLIKGKCDDKPVMREHFCHVCILEQKGAMVFGRDREYKLILQYAKGEIPQEGLVESWAEINPDYDNEAGNTENDEKENQKEVSSEKRKGYRNIVAIVAEPGAGKSSLMAKCAIEASKVELDAFIHFVGCSGVSTCHLNLLKRLCLFLLPYKDPKMEEVLNMDDSNILQETLDKLLEERRQSGKPLLILIDDLSQLSPGEGYLNWIPKTGLPENITLVTSMVKGDKVVDSIKERTNQITWLNLGYLTDKARHEIVTSYLKRYNKVLDPEQTELVVKSEGAKNALWLTMACEELRVFGFFDLLTQYIRELPYCLDALLEKILVRLVSEDETSLLKETLCFMECARDGLREAALQLLLGDMDEKKPVPMLHWAMVNRTLKPFIRVASTYQQLNQLTFYHQAIGKAVRKRWLSDKGASVKHHRLLADYYQNHCTDDHILGREAAYHISHSKDGARMMDFVKNDSRSRYIDAITISRYIKDYKCKTIIQRNANSGGRQLFSCPTCSNKRQAFSKHQMFPNKDSCILCGKSVLPNFKKPENEAYWCAHHPRRGPFYGNQPICHICKRVVMKPEVPLPLYLCHFCQRGGFTTCCWTPG